MKRIIFSFTLLALAMNANGQVVISGNDTANTSALCFCRVPDPLKKMPGYEDALRYAPILWFADEEQYFPTLPFFSAFDGVDNDCDQKTDFDDADEVAPIDRAYQDSSKATWDQLQKWYDQLQPLQQKRILTVLYHQRTTSAKKIKEIFFNDEQFWRRLEIKVKSDSAFKAYLDSDSTIYVYEYYFYYVRDKGLQGHPHDMERVFIFVADEAPVPFRIFVGDGHGDGTPNNVLIHIENGWHKSHGPFDCAAPACACRSNNNHIHFLVELGGHSMSPDFNANGLFEPVVDANWHYENLWGTRDIQAKVGGGATGLYQPWITFQRRDSLKVFPPDTTLDLPPQHTCYRLLPAESFKELDMILSRQSLAATFLKCKTDQNSSSDNAVALNCLHDKDDLSWLADKVDKNKTGVNIDSYIEEKFNFLNEVAIGYNPSNAAAKLSAFHGVPCATFWTKDIVRNLSATGIPTQSPRGWALLNQFGYNAYPKWSLARLVDLKTAGVLEFQIGTTIFSRLNRQNPELTALYDGFYRKTFSPYGKISWMHHREANSDLNLGVGVSFVPSLYIMEIRPPDFFRHFRLRAGIKWGFRDMDKASLRDLLEFQIGFYRAPIAFQNSYNVLKSQRHKVWEHHSYKGEDPTSIFKPHLFRPRHYRGFGIWTVLPLQNDARPDYRISWIVPAWDFVPVKLDGILEIQAWLKQPHFSNIRKLNAEKLKNQIERQRWVFALYYDRFYGKLVSWYANAGWINNLNEKSKYSLGIGVSFTFGPLVRDPIIEKPFSLHWFKMRLGLRSEVDRQTYQLMRHHLEMQLGLHY